MLKLSAVLLFAFAAFANAQRQCMGFDDESMIQEALMEDIDLRPEDQIHVTG